MCDGPSTTTVTATKDELLDYHKHMYIIRRMEITCDTEYKVPGWQCRVCAFVFLGA